MGVKEFSNGIKKSITGYKRLEDEANGLTNDEAIEIALRESYEYRKAKLVEEETERILKENNFPVVFMERASGENLKDAMKVLSIKGLSMPEEEEIVLTRDDVIGGLENAMNTMATIYNAYGGSISQVRGVIEKINKIMAEIPDDYKPVKNK